MINEKVLENTNDLKNLTQENDNRKEEIGQLEIFISEVDANVLDNTNELSNLTEENDIRKVEIHKLQVKMNETIDIVVANFFDIGNLEKENTFRKNEINQLQNVTKVLNAKLVNNSLNIFIHIYLNDSVFSSTG